MCCGILITKAVGSEMLPRLCVCTGLEASSPRHWYLFQGHVNPELFHSRHFREDRR